MALVAEAPWEHRQVGQTHASHGDKSNYCLVYICHSASLDTRL